MAPQPPQTAAAAVVGFFRDLAAAILLRRAIFADAVADAGSWRRGAVVVILASLASDSLGLYSDLDLYLVQRLANWSLLPIMIVALLRWGFGTTVALGVARVLSYKMELGNLLRPSGYAYAPAVIYVLPAFLYWFDLVPVTLGLVVAVRVIVLPWLIVALTYAALAAGVTSRPAAVAVAVSLFISANLFDVFFDLLVGAATRELRTAADLAGWHRFRSGVLSMTGVLAAGLLSLGILVSLAATGRLNSLRYEFHSQSRYQGAWLLLFTVLYAAIALPAVMSTDGAPPSVADLSYPSLFLGHAVLVIFLLAWWRLRRPQRLVRFLRLDGLRASDWRDGLVLGARVWGFTFGIAIVAGLILQLALGDSAATGGTLGSAQGIEMVPDIMVWMVELPILHKLGIIFVAMTVEEAFFRAFLQTRIGLWPSSLLFAVAHASYGLPTLMIGVFIVSIVLGRDFAKHGQLVRCILGHGVFDAIQLLVVVPFAVRQLQMLSGTG